MPDVFESSRAAAWAGRVDELAARIEQLEAAREAARTRKDRRPINKELHMVRSIWRMVDEMRPQA